MRLTVPMATGYEGLPFAATKTEKEKEKEEAEAFTVKARAAQEAVMAEEASFVVKAGCGSKRKAEEDLEEEEAFTVKAKPEEEDAFAVQPKEEEEVEDSDDDCDSEEEADVDHEEFMARLIADYNAHADKLRADYPGMKCTDYSTEEYAYMRRQPEEVEDSDDAYEKFRAEYGDLFHKLKEEGSHGVDGLVPV